MILLLKLSVYLKISIDSIEYLCLISHNIIYALFYIPPDIASGEINVLFKEIINVTDDLHKLFHNKHTIFLGDFNRLPYRTLCANLAIKNIVTENTRGNAKEIRCPLLNSDHRSIYIYKQSSEGRKVSFRTLLDMRQSNLSNLSNDLSMTNWSIMHRKNTL